MKSPKFGGKKGFFHPKLFVILQLPVIKGVHLTDPSKDNLFLINLIYGIKTNDQVVYFKSFDITVVTQFKP
jgi:hypothetical protein